MERTPTQAETRQLLLDAAGAVFAERGYRDTTVREICRRARVNIAAVNYHFGDKEALYREVLRYGYGKALAKYPSDFGLKPGASAEERLQAFVRSFLFRILDTGPVAWHGKLIAKEMINPSSALDVIVEERLRPMASQLSGVLRQLLVPAGTSETLRLCVCSVVSQCVFYHQCRPVVSRLFPNLSFEAEDIERLADHITRFSLAALQQFARAGRRRRQKRP